jgi:hypothetical protein
VTLGHVFLNTSVFFCQNSTMLHTHLNLHVASTRRTNGRSLASFKKAVVFRKSGNTEEKSVFTLFCFYLHWVIAGVAVLARLNTRHKFGSSFDARLHCREKRLLASSCPSVRLSTCVSTAVTVRISSKFDIGGHYENLWRKSRLGYSWTKILGT